MDSIIARPTNKVRVIVGAASGCWARALKAVETARPWPIAGPKTPTPMVIPAVMIEAAAMIVVLSIRLSLCGLAAAADGRRQVNRRQNGEDVGLDHAGQQPKGTHRHRKNERRNGEQNCKYHSSAH